jgi:queuine tRNA-ribosyltransferase
MQPNTFLCELIKKHKRLPARITRVTTPHGEFITPVFMPVGTRACVNHMSPKDLQDSKSQIILGGNTYHMLCAPGLEVIQANGGMHQFMNWHQPMLTDSGGFQVFSLSKEGKLCTIDEEGAHFQHPYSGKTIHMTPEMSLHAQKIIGADIIMAFDQCTPDTVGEDEARHIMQRTHRWLLQSREFQDKFPNSVYGLRQAFFGIIQGASFKNLRHESKEFILSIDPDGIAIGGETIGFDMQKTPEILSWLIPDLPDNKPRYTMGVGLMPQDLIDVVQEGIDMFDCVAPTRNARHGSLYSGEIVKKGDWLAVEGETKISIKRSIYANDDRPIMENCDCTTCEQYSRSYMHYLFKANSPLYSNLACNHNVRVMQRVCEVMRECIEES